MKVWVLLFVFAAMPVFAQAMDGMDMGKMPGMAMLAKKALKPKVKKPKTETPPQAQAPAQSMPDMPGMTMPVKPDAQSGQDGIANRPMPPDSKPMPDMAQDNMSHDQMSGMDMSHGMAMHGLLGGYGMSREASGTSWQPEAAPHAGIHLMVPVADADWMVMLHGRINGISDWQSGPRGGDQVLSTSMLMAMATHDLADGDTLGLKVMLSGDPFMGRRGYPLLLASGETANGVTPLIDRQHPHDLFMEMAVSYSHPLSDTDSLFLYGGYPGEPALGPAAYMHRISAEDDPMTPISHHWLDSTHVTFGVVTAGLVLDQWKLEVSQFTGREPDQYRFDFDQPRFDSTAARFSFNPDSHWSLQVSTGWLKSPEQLEPLVDEQRVTASATYYNDFSFGSLAATLAFGRKHLSSGVSEDGFLAEVEYKPDPLWTLFARGESISSDELVPGPAVRGAGELSFGVIHDWALDTHWKAGLGGLYAFDFAPSSATASYGGQPHGAAVFVRLVAE
jgi:hypothetical protein